MRDNSTTINKEFEKSKEYWQGKFSREASEINLPCDFERSLVYKREKYKIRLSGDLSNKLLSLSKNKDLLLYVVLLSALNVLIFKYTDKEDICIGAPVYIEPGKPAPVNKGEGGPGETLIIFREVLDNNMTFKELLLNVKRTLIQGYENQHYVLGVTIPMKFLSRVILVLDNFHKMEIIHHIVNSPDNDIAISISKSADGLAGSIGYNSKLFKQDTIKWLCKHYLYVLEQVTGDINIKLSGINLLTDEEKERIIYDFNNTGASYPQDKTIHALIEKQVEKAPGNIAVLCQDKKLTYGELQEKANRLARVLKLKGVTANTIVGLMIESPIETVIGIIGVLKAGGAYLPIEPGHPAERKEHMLNDSKAGVLVTEHHISAANRPLLGRLPGMSIVLIDKIAAEEGSEISNRELNIGKVNPVNLAYVIYTSGTTGRPKGTLIQHGGIVNYTSWRLETYKYTQKDVTLQMLSYGFDGFGSNFYSSLLSGGVLLMIPDSYKLDFNFIKGAIRQYKVTNMSVVPTIYQMILDSAEKGSLQSLRFVVLAGEKSSGGLVRKSKEKAPAVVIFNEYGPTEATVTAAGHSCIEEFNTAVIGKPIYNSRIYILDTSLKPVPIRVTGELYIEGAGVAPGYLNNPELTADRFIETVPVMKTGRVYRTGDLARWLPDGNLELLGRKDSQVKIRGFRIEPQEIEARLIEIDKVKQAIVLDFEDQEGEKNLCAYFLSDEKMDISKLKDAISEALPDYMIPSYFMQLDKIPLNPSGKIDFKALPVPQPEAGVSCVAPRDQLEEKLASIWADVLGIEKENVGIDNNFFELGGHSLRATRLISRVSRELNVKIPLGEMFKVPTIRGLAGYIKREVEPSDAPINPVEKKDFYELSYNQRRLWIAYLREPGSAAYHLGVGVPLDQPLDPGLIKKVLYRLVQRHESLRTSFRMIGDEPVQLVEKCTRVEIPLQVMDISMMADSEKIKQLERLYQQAVTVPFDLATPPLFRALLIKLAAGKHEFIFYMHHIITDGWSLEVMQEEFLGFYQAALNGETFEPAPLKLQYKEFAHWQNKQVSDPGFRDNAHRYWKQKLEPGMPRLELPLDFNEGKTDKLGAVYRCVLDKELKEKLQKLAQSHNTTLFIVLFCAYNILLSHVSGQDEIVCSVISAGRDHPLLNNIVGYFVNSMCFKITVNHEEGYTDLLQRVSSDFPDTLLYQQYAIELVLGELKMKYPEFSVSFNMLNIQQGTTEQEIKSFEPRHISNMVPINFETHIELYVSEYRNGIEMNWRYRKASFKPGTIENIAKGYLKLCRYITEEDEE